MTTAPSIDHALPPVLQRDGACLREGVARRHGRWRNPARTTPRSSLRTTTNQPRHNAQRWVEKVGRSIKGSDTPHPDPHRDNTTRLHAAIGYVTPDDEHHGRGPASAEPCRRPEARPPRTDQAQSSQQDMSTLKQTDHVAIPLGKRGALEGVARRHGRRRNPARKLPRSSLRTPENQIRHSPQRWVEKRDRSVANSETPHSNRGLE